MCDKHDIQWNWCRHVLDRCMYITGTVSVVSNVVEGGQRQHTGDVGVRLRTPEWEVGGVAVVAMKNSRCF